ncbi:unnamed protein product [Paramecium primaurelia]|uniref:Uncharacterized protein n=1 Tax=Paramecium primaurelia TaxID=5886 RepID=A0A8S1JSG8_PARPR|nr:unnamed protein product [Paramecium primaurelia]
MNIQVHFYFKSFKVIDLLEDSLTYYSKRISLIYNIDKVSKLFLIQNQQLNQRKIKNQLYKFYFQRNIIKKIQNSRLIVMIHKLKNKFLMKLKLIQKAPKQWIFRQSTCSQTDKILQKIDFLISQINGYSQDIINFSLKNQILCSKTAFICEVLNEKICKNQLRTQLRKSSSLNHNQNMYIKEMLQISQTIKKSVQVEKQDQLFGMKSLMQQLPLVRRIKMDSHEEEDTQKINYQDLLNISNNKQNINDSEELILSKKCLKMEEREVSNVLQSQKYFKRMSKCYQIQNQLTACKQIVVSSQKHILKINQNQKIYIGQQWFPFYLKLFCQDSKSSWQLFIKAINYLQKKGVNYLLKKERAFQIMKNFLTMQKLEIQNQIIFQTNNQLRSYYFIDILITPQIYSFIQLNSTFKYTQINQFSTFYYNLLNNYFRFQSL